MRELWLILAMLATCAAGQPVLPPPPELDQAVMENPVRVGDRTNLSLHPLPRIVAEYSEEARIAQLEGVVRLAVTDDKQIKVTQSLGLGLDESAVRSVTRLLPEALPPYGEPQVQFMIPNKRSRWHLLAVKFREYEDTERAHFRSVLLPEGAGIVGDQAIDHAQVVAALGKTAWAVVAFDIDGYGLAARLTSIAATDPMWAEQAIGFIHEWRFVPAILDGDPIPTRCVVGLAWGARNLDVKKIEELQVMLKGELRFEAKTAAANGPAR